MSVPSAGRCAAHNHSRSAASAAAKTCSTFPTEGQFILPELHIHRALNAPPWKAGLCESTGAFSSRHCVFGFALASAFRTSDYQRFAQQKKFCEFREITCATPTRSRRLLLVDENPLSPHHSFIGHTVHSDHSSLLSGHARSHSDHNRGCPESKKLRDKRYTVSGVTGVTGDQGLVLRNMTASVTSVTGRCGPITSIACPLDLARCHHLA